MDQLLPYIDKLSSSAFSVGVIIVLYFLIKSQMEQINHMKTSIDAMKAYIDMFKVDEFKKYAELVASNAKDEGFKEFIDQLPEMVKRIMEEEQENLSNP